jgi:hypothetical protein
MPDAGAPLSFNGEEMAVLEALARPIDQGRRDAFLKAVASSLGEARGAGRVHQAARQIQREYFDPPELDDKGFHGARSRRRT